MTIYQKKQTLKVGGKLLDISNPIVMGIVNITPDSFYEGSRVKSEKDLLLKVEKMIVEGADIIDIGATTSKPGSPLINEEEEIRRLIPMLKTINQSFSNLIISVDTYNSKTAQASIDYGAKIINDISAGDFDNNMFDVIIKNKVPYVLMHIKGTPENMQNEPTYKNVVKEIILHLSSKVDILKKNGVCDLMIDPGFGFGKTAEQNYQLLNNLDLFNMFQLPLVVGISRKSMINRVLDIKASEALNGTTVLNTIALIKGANILRVHDVKEAKEAIRLVSQLN